MNDSSTVKVRESLEDLTRVVLLVSSLHSENGKRQAVFSPISSFLPLYINDLHDSRVFWLSIFFLDLFCSAYASKQGYF